MTNEIKAAVESLEHDVTYQGQLYYLLPDYKRRIKFVCQALRAAEQGRRQVEQENATLKSEVERLQKVVEVAKEPCDCITGGNETRSSAPVG